MPTSCEQDSFTLFFRFPSSSLGKSILGHCSRWRSRGELNLTLLSVQQRMLYTHKLSATHTFHTRSKNNQCLFLEFQTVDKLREHFNRHLPRLGKKKIDSLVVNYVAKLVGPLFVSVCIRKIQREVRELCTSGFISQAHHSESYVYLMSALKPFLGKVK